MTPSAAPRRARCKCGRAIVACPGGPHGEIPCGGYVHADDEWHTCSPQDRNSPVATPSGTGG